MHSDNRTPPLSTRTLAIAALAYVLAWSLLPPLLTHSLPLDVVESLTWGREWQWGTHKHPPLVPWLLQLSWLAFGTVGPYLLSQLCIAVTLWYVWRTGCRLMTPERAFIGTVLAMGVVFYTRPALEFNHNIAQMPIWAALGHGLLAAMQDGRMRRWLALGLWAGLGLLTKYWVAVLLACMGLYLLCSPARRTLRRPGPWAALALTLALLVPHLYWLWQSDWLPMAYVGSRADAAEDGARWAALVFLALQALDHLPMALILLAALLGARHASRPASTPTRWRLHTDWRGYLLTLALAPGLLVTLLGLLLGVRLHDMWGVPMWAFSGLLAAAFLPTAWLAPVRARVLLGVAVWLVLVSLASGAYLAWGAQWRHRPARTDWPAAALGAQAQHAWNALSRCPIDTVAGEHWLAGLVALASPDRPSVLINGDARYSPWVNLERLQTRGALWVWQPQAQPEPEPPAPLDALRPNGDMRLYDGQWQIAWPYDPTGAPLTVRWRAYVPGACARAAQDATQRPASYRQRNGD